MKELIKDGRRFCPPSGNYRRDAWTDEQDQVLRDMTEKGRPLHEIVTAVNALDGNHPTRSAKGVEYRLRYLKLPTGCWGWTADALRKLFGVSPNVVHRWLEAGAIEGARSGHGAASKGTPWVVSDAQLEAFLKTQRWRYDWRKISDPRVRSRAEVYNRVDPWIPIDVAARMLGVATRQLYYEPWLSRFGHRRSDVKATPWGSTPRVYLRSEILAYLANPDSRSEEQKRRQSAYKGKPRKGARITNLLDSIARRVA